MELNQKIESWTIIDIYRKGKKVYYTIRCKCGFTRTARKWELKKIQDPDFRNLKVCCRTCKENQYWKNISEVDLYSSLHNDYKNQAKRRNKFFDLKKKDTLKLFKSNCKYCGNPPQNEWKHKTNDNIILKYQGIDRVDPSKGYTINNTVPCCKMCNYAKRDYTEQEFLDWIYKVYTYNVQRLSEESEYIQVDGNGGPLITKGDDIV